MEEIKKISDKTKNLVKRLNENDNWSVLKKLSGKESLNQSAFSDVYELENDKVVKVFNKDEYRKMAEEGVNAIYDYEALIELQDTNLTPKIYIWEPKKYVVMEKITGDTIYDMYLKGMINNEIRNHKVYRKVQESLIIFIQNGWTPMDLKPFHIYTTENGELKFIDFSLYERVENPKYSLELAKLNFDLYIDEYLK